MRMHMGLSTVTGNTMIWVSMIAAEIREQKIFRKNQIKITNVRDLDFINWTVADFLLFAAADIRHDANDVR